ncbi:MAG: YkgJ family cysteine cluster protein [Desulfuromonadales bacterium]|nr:YkgJ family cysteine cluster protein [Desulfuromonadales bacterium]
MGNYDFSSCREEVSRAIATAGGDVGQLMTALREAIHRAEQRLVDSDEMDGSLIACRAGCKSCCVVNVAVLLPEAIAIAEYLRRWPQAEREEVVARLDELWRAIRGLTDDERISVAQPCAFLDADGACRIYPVRPLLCRSITSTSAENCRQALTDQLFDQSRPVLMNLFQRENFEAVYLGVGDGLERAGLEHRSMKLTGFVRYLLMKPRVEAALLAGKMLDWHELG